MGRLIYSMITSLDGYVSGPDDGFDWAPDLKMLEDKRLRSGVMFLRYGVVRP